MSTNSNTRKKKYFVYVTAPKHINAKLINLNKMQFNSKCITAEE